MNDRPATSRRPLLTFAAVALAALGPALPSSEAGGPCTCAGRDAVLAGPDERGERLHVEGLVLAPDGTTPVEGVVVYAYQTDWTGRYSESPGAPPRLRGFMRTDRDGRFRYDTVRPAAYPGGKIPAHVHHQLWGAGYPPQWASDLLFEDDPLVSADERRRSEALGAFANVRPVVRHELHGPLVKIRLRLKKAGDRFEEGTRHGIAVCHGPGVS